MGHNIFITIFVLLSLVVLLITAVFPLVRKRPIVFSNKTLLILATSIELSLLLSGYVLFTIVVLLWLVCLLFVRIWLIIGITNEDLSASLDRTIKGTLVKAQLNPSQLKVEFMQPLGTINFYHKFPFNIKVCIPRLPISPKTKLFQSVLKKLIDNYYIRI